MHAAFSLLLATLGASAALIPTNSSDSVNATIPAYIDPVLTAVATDPPTDITQASVVFTNGARKLTGAYFNLTERAGLNEGNLTVVELVFAFPEGLSTTNNVFAYHIHEKPIAFDDQACTSAGGHWDPLIANGTEGLASGEGGLYHPNPGNLSSFQLGDLAGRWGALTSSNGSVSERIILDNYVRLSGELSVLGRSIVIHDAPTNKRIACGNITLANFGTGLNVTANYSTTSTNSSSSHSGGDQSAARGLTKTVTAAGMLTMTAALFASVL